MQSLSCPHAVMAFFLVCVLCACDDAATSTTSRSSLPAPPSTRSAELADGKNCARPYFYNFLNARGTIVCLNLAPGCDEKANGAGQC